MKNKKIENLLNYQEKVASGIEVSETQDLFLETCKNMLEEILSNKKYGQLLKDLAEDGYNEFRRVWKEVFAEKGGNTTIEDIRKIVPTNFWLKILNNYTKNNLIEKDDGDIKNIQDELKKELEEARKNNKIN